MNVNLAKVGQNLSWPTRDINALLETRDNYCDILLENGWTLLNRLLLTLIRKIVGVSKHRRKNGCSGIGLLSDQEPREFLEKQSVFANGIWRYSLFTATQFLRWVRVGSKRSVLKSLGFLSFCELFNLVARKRTLFAVWGPIYRRTCSLLHTGRPNMTEENYNYRTSQALLRNQFPGKGKLQIPIIPKFEERPGDFNDLLLIGFDKTQVHGRL